MPAPGADVTPLVRSWVARLALGCVVAAAASAQELSPAPPKQRGGFFVPTLSVAETFDDNLLFTQAPESDFITRVDLAAQTGYRSTPFTIDGQASRAADMFRIHPDFNTAHARTMGQLSLNYAPSRRLSLSGAACYIDTLTPSELNVLTGLVVGRSQAHRTSATPWIEYRASSVTTVRGLYGFAEDTLDGRFSGTQTASVGVERRWSTRDTWSLRYERRWYHFTRDPIFAAAPLPGETTTLGDLVPSLPGAPANPVAVTPPPAVELFVAERSTADVVMLGWQRDIDPRTLLLLQAGPRSSKGSLSPEILLSLKRRLQQGRLSLTYAKSQATTLGKVGALDTQSLVLLFAGRPAKQLEIASGPGLYRNALRGQQLAAMRLNVETLWHFAPVLHLAASYVFDLQQPDFGAPGHIRRGALAVRLILAPPQRRAEPATTDTPALSESH